MRQITSSDTLCATTSDTDTCFCSYAVANVPGTIDITRAATL